MMLTSTKRKLIGICVDTLASRNVTRAALIGTLLERYFPEVLAVVLKNHGKVTLDALLESHPIEALDALAKTHYSEMITAMCREHLQEVISEVVEKGQGAFRYVGNGKIKVIVGAASQRLPGWLATDIGMLNITQESAWINLFNPGSIDNILAEHVIEHLSLDELHRVFAHARRYLKAGGIFRIAVPDAFHPSRYYYNLVKPGGWETPIEHKLFLDHEMLARIAEQSGYQIRLLEYFDESGVFHKVDYSPDDGSIQRCATNNCGLDTTNEEVMEMFYSTIPYHLRQQFYDEKISYTSLIADFIP